MKIYIQTEEKTPFWDIPQKNRFNGNRWHNCHLKPGFSCPPWCKAINDIIIWNLPSDWYRWWADQKGVPVTRLTSGGIWWASAVVVPSVSVLLKVPCVSSRLLSPFGTFWILIFLFCISIWTLLFRCTLFSCFICNLLCPCSLDSFSCVHPAFVFLSFALNKARLLFPPRLLPPEFDLHPWHQLRKAPLCSSVAHHLLKWSCCSINQWVCLVCGSSWFNWRSLFGHVMYSCIMGSNCAISSTSRNYYLMMRTFVLL